MFDWLHTDVETAAKRLLGSEIIREFDDSSSVRAKIVEVEAYDQTDPAAHSFAGPSPRNKAMFLGSGHLYVYFTYGMHYCANIVTGPAGHGSGVLIRALQPLEGWEAIRRNRPGLPDGQLTNGPAKSCQSLGIDFSLSRHDLSAPPLRLIQTEYLPEDQILATSRIGISKARNKLRRFYITGNRYVSGE